VSYLFTIIHISVPQRLVPLDFSRYSERRHKIEKCSSPFILSNCCELCALKQKPGVLLDIFFFAKTFKKPKSQLQTVLITASGPQALNALVHRKRYTQGSRQNRCVSSQYALALRARVRGTGKASVPVPRPPISIVKPSGSLVLARDRWGGVITTDLRRPQKPSPLGTPAWRLKNALPEKLPTQNCLRRGIQLYN